MQKRKLVPSVDRKDPRANYEMLDLAYVMMSFKFEREDGLIADVQPFIERHVRLAHGCVPVKSGE